MATHVSGLKCLYKQISALFKRAVRTSKRSHFVIISLSGQKSLLKHDKLSDVFSCDSDIELLN